MPILTEKCCIMLATNSEQKVINNKVKGNI